MSTMKHLTVFILSMVIVLATAPSADAWSWKTHSDIVDVVYYGLPPEVQKNLNLEIMRNGSNEPDEVFKDFRHHSYPNSYDKAKSWLDKGKIAYDRGDYDEASFNYGVATHYISDTFSAPHCISKEEYSDHSRYENRAKKLTPVVTYNNSTDLNTKMKNAYNQGSEDWVLWLDTGDTSIIQANLNNGASASLVAVNESINSEASPDLWTQITDIIRKYVYDSPEVSG